MPLWEHVLAVLAIGVLVVAAVRARGQTTLPKGASNIVRNMMPTRDGNLAIACSGANRVEQGLTSTYAP